MPNSIPIIPLSHLDILSKNHNQEGEFILTLDAKMRECYWARFCLKDNIITKTHKDTLSCIEELQQHNSTPILGWNKDRGFTSLEPSSKSLLDIARHRLEQGVSEQTDTTSPLTLQYLRDGNYWKKWQHISPS